MTNRSELTRKVKKNVKPATAHKAGKKTLRQQSFKSSLNQFKSTKARNLTDALVASIGEGLVIVNEYGDVTHVNHVALEILGYSKEEMIGVWLGKALPSFDMEGRRVPNSERPALKSLITGLPITELSNYKRKDGSFVPVYTTGSPFLIGGKPKGAIIVFRDVTKEMQIERAKDEFVSIASHQLRTPLTSIRLFSELLKEPHYGKLTAKQLDFVDKILSSTEKMIALVNNLLNISRLNLGHLEIRLSPTNIVSLVEGRIEEIRPVAERKHIKLSFRTGVDYTEVIKADNNLLAQAIHNLLSNAIRYSKPEGGKVIVQLKKNVKDYEISVSDNGIGIPPGDHARIYERFFRAENALSTQAEGTGLGLYLVKQIIEASGGKTWYQSQPGKGTTFYLTIPIK